MSTHALRVGCRLLVTACGFFAGSAVISGQCPAALVVAGADAIFCDDFESAECAGWGASSNPTGGPDVDADQFGDDGQPTTFCELPDGFVPDATDCDDDEPGVNPGATEICDGVDQDCDKLIDEDFVLNSNPACVSFVNLGNVDGDAGAQVVSVSQYDERFYLVTVEESLTAPGSIDLLARVTLDVPAGKDYDLFVYCVSCGGLLAGSSTLGAGLDETVEVGRDDISGDQTYAILVEVRYILGTGCALWTLSVTGNQPTSNRACN